MFGWLGRVLGGKEQTSAAAPSASPVPVPAERPLHDEQALLAEGNRLLDTGQLEQAAAMYERALDANGRSAAAAVNLGFVRLQQGRTAQAVAALERACEADANNADAHFLLGSIALDTGDATRAIAQLEAALSVQPALLPAKATLIRALASSGQMDEARAVAMSAVQAHPDVAELHLLLGNLLRVAEDFPGALRSLEQATALDPGSTETWVSLAQTLVATGRTIQAHAALKRALSLRPASAAQATVLGDEMQKCGDVDGAVTAYRMAVQMDPGHKAAHQNMGIVLQAVGRNAEALSALERARDLAPDAAESWCNLGIAQLKVKQNEQAQQSFERAQQLLSQGTDSRIDAARVQQILAVQALERGETQEALAGFERSIAHDPTVLQARSHQLFAMSYVDAPERTFAAAREYGRLAAEGACPYGDWLVPAAGAASGALRVGLVSGDLCSHPVGYFTESVLQHLKRLGIELVAFPTSHHQDEVTARLQASMAGWFPLGSMSDAVAARHIRDARIDVLLDLGGHTAHNRLPVFCWRPAPVQASWLGYWATTGIDAMDWVIADPYSVESGEETQFVERVWRLPHTRLCFTAPASAAEVAVSPLPAAQGPLTFGCMQNISKAGDAVLDVWRRVLEAVPDSRLRLQNKQAHGVLAERLLVRLDRAGIPAHRVTLAPPAARAEYLSAYAHVDLLLDTFPFPGGTTTCEALWMGVPTVTLSGKSMVANQGKALMSCAGLADWVATDVDDYVRRAVAFAADREALARLRARLREQVLASPLFDAPQFAVDLASALRGMREAAPRQPNR